MTDAVEIKIKKGSLTLKKSPDDTVHVDGHPDLAPNTRDDRTVINGEHIAGEVHATILIPSSTHQIHASIGRGPCQAVGLSTDQGDLNLGLGRLQLEDTHGSWDINVGKGDARLSDSTGTFDLNVGMGRLEMLRVSGRAEINAGMGPVVAEGCHGTVTVNAGKGNIQWKDGGGSLHFNAGMGDVAMENTVGDDLEINAGLGKIHVRGGRWERAKLEVGVGEATVQSRVLDLTVTARHRGAIMVSIPEDLGARVEASTDHGRIVSHLNLIPVGHSGPQRGQRLVGLVGDGQGRIALQTRRGNITLAQHPADADASRQPDASRPSQTGDQRILILERLQQGTLTVEEADALLEAMDGLGPTDTPGQ